MTAARPPRAAIFGCAGARLVEAERAFFAEADPLGFILFARNCVDPAQVAALVAALRGCVGRADAPVLIDQEGGRVARLRPPHWRAPPTGMRFGDLWAGAPRVAEEAVRLNARLIAAELSPLGITIDCAPVLDVAQPGAHEVIGDRAFAGDAEAVTRLGRAFADGLGEGGVLPVAKHVPGHGRATVDSHAELPVVAAPLAALRAVDFPPFRALNDLPLAMTAHVVYRAIDADNPATTSARVIAEVIRGEIGFEGMLVSDDLSMGALTGTLAGRAERALAAGCDVVLHCNGRMAEMLAVAGAAPRLAGPALARVEAALARRRAGGPFDAEAALRRLGTLLGEGTRPAA
ncbi:MAG: beta-N-acetylhexosaminidase [Proteobacteria bacterium]|nr:beta-N-acetylhexosaminidase [Pseudomonadota bacterium]